MKKRKLRLYLDNSVISMYYSDIPYLKKITRAFWRDIIPDCDIFISEMVIREIGATSDAGLRKSLENLIDDIKILQESKEVISLATLYLSKRRMPLADALHLAYASLSYIDYFVTWNQKHLYKKGTQEMIEEINLANRLPILKIITPEIFSRED